MRKVFSVMVLAALITGMVWAQDEEEEAAGEIKIGSGVLTISGVAKGGLRAVGDTATYWYQDGTESKEGSYAADVYGYSDDIDDGTAIRADITATYTNGPVGARIRLRDNVKGDNYFLAQSAYGWVNLFGEKVVVTGGIIGDDVWGTAALGGTGTDDSFDDRNVRLAIQPIPGLTFGASWGFDFSQDQLKKDSARQSPQSGEGIGEFFANTVIGALYSNSYFGANVSLKLNHGFVYTSGTDEKNGSRGVDLLFGVKITALPKLTFIVDGKFTKLGLDKDSLVALLANDPDYDQSDPDTYYVIGNYVPTSELYAKVAYRVIDPLNLGLRFHLKGVGSVGDSQADDMIVKTDFDLRLFADYTVKEWVIPGIHLQMDFKGLTKSQKDAQDVTGYPEESKISDGLSIFHIQPKCTFKLSGVTFNIYDDIGIVMDKGVDNNKNGVWHSADKAGKAKGSVKNTFQIDFIWEF